MVDLLLILLVLTNFRVLGTSRLPGCIQAVAFQGVLLGLLPLALHPPPWEAELVLMGALSILIKGAVFPWLLYRALAVARVKQEVEPYVGFNLSLGFGVLALAAGLAVDSQSPGLLVPVALSTVLVGLFITVSRRKALTQALGYLIFENGIHAFGAAVLGRSPLIVELGILLDIFFAVFVMGITMFHISRSFDSLDTSWMIELKE